MRRLARIAALAAALVAGLGLMVLVGLWLILPAWIETRLVPDLARRHGVSAAGVDVRRIGLTGIDLADLRVGDALRVDSLRVDFVPLSLRRGRIDRVVLSGLTLRADWSDGGLHLPGIDLSAVRPADSTVQPQGAPRIPPLTAGRIEVRRGVLVVMRNATAHRFPFDLDILPDAADLSKLKSRLTLFPDHGPLRILLQGDTAAGRLELAAFARRTDLVPLLAPFLDVAVQGRMTGRAEARLTFSPLQLRHLRGETTFENLQVGTTTFALCAAAEDPLRLAWTAEAPNRWQVDLYGGLRLTRPHPVGVHQLAMNASVAPDKDGRPAATVTAGANLQAGRPWNSRIEGLRLTADAGLTADGRPRGKVTVTAAKRIETPLPMAVNGLRLELAGDPKEITARGRVTVATGDGLLPADWNLEPVELGVDIEGRLEDSSRWRLRMAAAPSRPTVTVSRETLQASLRAPRLALDLEGDRETARFTGHLDVPDAAGQAGEMAWHTASISATASGALRLAEPANTARGRFALHLRALRAAREGMAAAAEQTSLKGRFGPGPSAAVTASIGMTGGQIELAAPAMTADGIALELPLRWPPAPSDPGRFAADRLRYAGFDLGRLAGTVQQDGRGARFSAKWEGIVFADLALTLDGRTQWSPGGPRLELAADLPHWRPGAPVDLGRFAPAAAGIAVSGGVTARADLTLTAGRPQSAGRLVLDDLVVDIPEKHVRLSGITANLRLVDLIEPRSAPGQVLRIAAVEAGAVRITGAELQFQVEDDRQVLLEKGRFGWCGGRVFAEATRFAPEADDYALTLFCDRLRLADLLDQLGGLAAEGEGTVSGRIPLRHGNGRWVFDDGFLYSSPGAGGKIRVTGVERLTRGIPPETLEYAQLALASEALKDYDYMWAKVGIDTEDETLTLRLQFDGKPARPLPFVYRRKLGRFVRVDGDMPGSDFQGIGLDVNFRLPLDQILQYGDLLQRIE